ncbi:MAG: hypothetical protein AB1Z23_00180 [Eubacteriales bacterium]
MIQDIENGITNCVLVKDLSRFGREHIEGDYYLEKFFPSKGVRFIAMLDNIDSVADPERMNSIEVPLMNLLNEQYLRMFLIQLRSASALNEKKVNLLVQWLHMDI